MMVSGSVGTFCSKITLPASSTMHTDVSFTDTSRPTKCAISSLFLDARGRTDLDPLIIPEGAAHSASKAEPQPPRYTIYLSGSWSPPAKTSSGLQTHLKKVHRNRRSLALSDFI